MSFPSDDFEDRTDHTELPAARELFTNRVAAIRRFAEYVHSEVPERRILYFHGEGGAGKTLLLDQLKSHFCKRVSDADWKYLTSLDDEALRNDLRLRAGEPLPTALLNFDLVQTRGKYSEQSQDPLDGMIILYRQLRDRKIKCPRFIMGCTRFLKDELRLTDQEIRDRLETQKSSVVWDWVKIGLNLIPGFSWGDAAGTIGKAGKQSEYVKAALEDLRPTTHSATESSHARPADWLHRLPTFLSNDIKQHLQEQSGRIVLFFDTLEAFEGREKERILTRLAEKQEEWFRLLLRSFCGEEGALAKGLIVVVAGRRADPGWHRVSKKRGAIPASAVENFLVGHFTDDDAQQYLERLRIKEPAVRHAIVQHASVAPGQVHPFYLGLCGDIAHWARDEQRQLQAEMFPAHPDHAEQSRDLIGRLLQYVSPQMRNTIAYVSACRSLTYDLFRHLGENLGFPHTRPEFELLRRFSFVYQPVGEQADHEEQLIVHRLLRREFVRAEPHYKEEITRAHAVLRDYYDSLAAAGDDGAIVEAIYHLNQLDPPASIDAWAERFERALGRSSYSLCESLLTLRHELIMPDEAALGHMALEAAQYFRALARYASCRSEAETAFAIFDAAEAQGVKSSSRMIYRGNALQSWGESEAALSRHVEAVEKYERAVQAYGQALKLAPDDVFAHNNRGNALQSWGKAEAALSRHVEAVEKYERAVQAYGQALKLAPDNVNAHNNQGNVLALWGISEAALSRHVEAVEKYERAVQAYGQALKLAPDFVGAHNNRGIALQSWGESEGALSRHVEAVEKYERAVQAYDQALKLAPDYVSAHNNRGNALQSWGESEAALSRHVEAVEKYERAVQAYGQALKLAPDYVNAHNNQGNVLALWGISEAALSRHVEAVEKYERAVEAYDQALKLAPDFVGAHNNRGIALWRWGIATQKVCNESEAVQKCRDALAAFDKALSLAPDLEVLDSLAEALEESKEHFPASEVTNLIAPSLTSILAHLDRFRTIYASHAEETKDELSRLEVRIRAVIERK